MNRGAAASRALKPSTLYDFLMAASATLKWRQKNRSSEAASFPQETPFSFQSTTKLTTAIDCQ
jgi:hypothetical protein